MGPLMIRVIVNGSIISFYPKHFFLKMLCQAATVFVLIILRPVKSYDNIRPVFRFTHSTLDDVFPCRLLNFIRTCADAALPLVATQLWLKIQGSAGREANTGGSRAGIQGKRAANEERFSAEFPKSRRMVLSIC
jgi:hypothetical protein